MAREQIKKRSKSWKEKLKEKWEEKCAVLEKVEITENGPDPNSLSSFLGIYTENKQNNSIG